MIALDGKAYRVSQKQFFEANRGVAILIGRTVYVQVGLDAENLRPESLAGIGSRIVDLAPRVAERADTETL